MDPYDGEVLGEPFDPKFELLRLNLGYALRYAKKMNIAEMIPRNELASTQYCLANPGREYLVYLPDGDKVAVDLSAVEWFNPRTGTTTGGGMSAGGSMIDFTVPFDGDAVLYLLLSQP
jgi:hypothetical protein